MVRCARNVNENGTVPVNADESRQHQGEANRLSRAMQWGTVGKGSLGWKVHVTDGQLND